MLLLLSCASGGYSGHVESLCCVSGRGVLREQVQRSGRHVHIAPLLLLLLSSVSFLCRILSTGGGGGTSLISGARTRRARLWWNHS